MKNGFTLIGIIIYIAIFFLFFVALVQFSQNIVLTAEKARVIHEVEQNARFALERITREIQSADDVNVGASTFESHPGVLSLADDTLANDPTVFDVSDGRLRITEGAGSPILLTSSKVTVTNLVFTDLSITDRTKNIHISLTVEHANAESITYTTSISIQNSIVIREEED